MTKDMTSGNPLKLIIGFAIPMFLGMLFQQFYSMVDTVIVGKFLGVGPLAGVGSTSSLNFLVIGFCTGVCNGFAIPVSQMFGAKRDSELRRFVANSAWLCVIFSVVITTAIVACCRPLLTLMHTPEDIFEYAWNEPYMGETKTLDVHISNIRKKLKEVTAEEYIETVWGIGYRLHE